MRIQFACSAKGFLFLTLLTQGCMKKFFSKDALEEHMSTHAIGEPRSLVVAESQSDGMTPIIEAMPPELQRKNRAVYAGPSRSLSIGQSRKRV